MHVTLPDGVRLATLTAGMAFGEMALLEPTAPPTCSPTWRPTAYEVPLRDFERFRKQHPRASERIMRNLAQLLADRLIVANAKVDLLTSGREPQVVSNPFQLRTGRTCPLRPVIPSCKSVPILRPEGTRPSRRGGRSMR